MLADHTLPWNRWFGDATITPGSLSRIGEAAGVLRSCGHEKTAPPVGDPAAPSGGSSGQSDGKGHQPANHKDEPGFPVDPWMGGGTADGATPGAHRGTSLSLRMNRTTGTNHEQEIFLRPAAVSGRRRTPSGYDAGSGSFEATARR